MRLSEEHPCTALCSADGICEIETAPQAIEATFTGRHETFQYTKVRFPIVSRWITRLIFRISIPKVRAEAYIQMIGSAADRLYQSRNVFNVLFPLIRGRQNIWGVIATVQRKMHSTSAKLGMLSSSFNTSDQFSFLIQLRELRLLLYFTFG